MTQIYTDKKSNSFPSVFICEIRGQISSVFHDRPENRAMPWTVPRRVVSLFLAQTFLGASRCPPPNVIRYVSNAAARAPMDRELFIQKLADRFPEVGPQISDYSHGLLHCEMADFRRVVEAAMGAGQHWRVEQYLGFVASCRAAAGPDLANAIDVSFIEDFALGEYTQARHQAVRERMPELLRRRLVAVDDRWR
jgi:hypothetical protein